MVWVGLAGSDVLDSNSCWAVSLLLVFAQTDRLDVCVFSLWTRLWLDADCNRSSASVCQSDAAVATHPARDNVLKISQRPLTLLGHMMRALLVGGFMGNKQGGARSGLIQILVLLSYPLSIDLVLNGSELLVQSDDQTGWSIRLLICAVITGGTRFTSEPDPNTSRV